MSRDLNGLITWLRDWFDDIYLTEHQDITGKANISDLGDAAFSNDYDDLTNKPNIPTDVSDLTDNNDTPFTPKRHTHIIPDVANLQTILNGKINISDLGNLAYEDDVDLSTHDVSELTDTQNTVFTPKSHTHTKSQITDFPTLSNVATSGSYNDLSNKPTIPTDVSDLTDNNNTAFTPKSHTHIPNDVTDVGSYMGNASQRPILNTYFRITNNLNLSNVLTNIAMETYNKKAEKSHTHTKSEITDFPTIPTKTSDLTNDGEDGTNFFVSDDDSRLSDARTPTSHIHSISDVTNLQTSLNNKANTSHTHIKENIDFQTTTSPFNIHLYANNYMVNRNDFEIPANAQMTLNFSDLLNNNQDYVSFKIIGTGGTLSSVEIWDSHGDILYTLNSSYTITIKKITGGYEVLVYDSGDIPTSYNENVAPFIYIENYSNNIITGSFSNKTYYRKATWLDMIYPIGSVYISTQNINPSLYFGGEWEQIEDRFLLSSGQNYNVQEEGGEATHTLTENEIPSHNHTQSSHNHAPLSGGKYKFAVTTGNISAGTKARKLPDTQTNGYYFMVNDANVTIAEDTTTNSKQPAIQNTGGGQAHNNMPPYFVVSVWERIA